MECDEKYLDENYEYTINREVEATSDDFSFGGGPGGQENQKNPKPNETTEPFPNSQTIPQNDNTVEYNC